MPTRKELILSQLLQKRIQMELESSKCQLLMKKSQVTSQSLTLSKLITLKCSSSQDLRDHPPPKSRFHSTLQSSDLRVDLKWFLWIRRCRNLSKVELVRMTYSHGLLLSTISALARSEHLVKILIRMKKSKDLLTWTSQRLEITEMKVQRWGATWASPTWNTLTLILSALLSKKRRSTRNFSKTRTTMLNFKEKASSTPDRR